ncbi:hypothetical protein [Tenacibaculum discolor]|uniref:hypothetical protein n=1 Tax=Tenacibaculum discolor TaxID=361581 RepID=UPI000EAEE184|nr:hypothetical protein [Tenacibaculum discolor]RLK06735.1 hypothetical protein C8N27_0296 [Tenacibaculum discolor]
MATVTECGNPSNTFSIEPLEMWEFTPIVSLDAEPTDYEDEKETSLVYKKDEKVTLSDKISKSIRDKYTLMEFTTESKKFSLKFTVKNGTTDQFYDDDGYIKPEIALAKGEKELTEKERIKITDDKSFLVDYTKKKSTLIELDIEINTETEKTFFINFYANDNKKYFDIEGKYKNVFCGQIKIIHSAANEWEFSLEKIQEIRDYAKLNYEKYDGSGDANRYHHCTDTHKYIVYKLLNHPNDLYLGKDQNHLPSANRVTPNDFKKAGESTTDDVRDKLISLTYAEPSKTFTVIDINGREVVTSNGQAGNTDVELSRFKESPVEYMKNKCPKDGYYVFIGAYNADYHSFTIVANKRGENISFEFIDQLSGVVNYTENNFENSKLLHSIGFYRSYFPMKLELYQLRNKIK